jgi:hypothetical protein
VIGPHFFAVPQLDDDANVTSQQDDEHCTNIVTEFLDETFPQRWFGMGGWKQRPPRFPDLTPLGSCETNRLMFILTTFNT